MQTNYSWENISYAQLKRILEVAITPHETAEDKIDAAIVVLTIVTGKPTEFFEAMKMPDLSEEIKGVNKFLSTLKDFSTVDFDAMLSGVVIQLAKQYGIPNNEDLEHDLFKVLLQKK